MDGQNWTTYTINVLRKSPVAGDLDLTFSSYFSSPNLLAVHPEGKLLVQWARFNQDGTLDDTFLREFGFDMVQLQPDLGMVVGTDSRLGKLWPNGSVVWNNWLTSEVRFASTVQVLQNGDILIGGDFNDPNIGNKKNGLRRYLSSGENDESFVSPVSETVLSALEPADGKLLICGQFYLRDWLNTKGVVARLLPDGSLDKTFQVLKILEGNVSGMVQQPDGKILAYGYFKKLNEQTSRHWVIRLNEDGSWDDSFLPWSALSGYVSQIALQADGKIIAMGAYSDFSDKLKLWRLNADGSLDSTFQVFSQSNLNGVILQKNGQIILSGPTYSNLNNTGKYGMVRIHNDPATESLTVPDASSILWLRGGSSPEARRVYFECSANGGESWTNLGLAHYISGGWELTGLSLPPNGTIRARAVIQSGPYNRSSGMVESLVDFSFPPAAIALETGEGQTWVSGGDCDFGSVGLGGMSRQTFVLKNTGETQLQGIRVVIDGDSASEFRLQTPVLTTLPKAGEQSLSILFNPAGMGDKQAIARIYQADSEIPPIEIHLLGEGIKGTAPKVKTLPATKGPGTATTLLGTVNALNLPRLVFLEYGLTKDLGSLAEVTPSQVEGGDVQTVQAEVSGLLPNTLYYYRIHAAGRDGGAVGATLKFTAGNHAPEARPDRWIIKTGTTLRLDVLANDEDTDGDTLTVGTFTPIEPANEGTLTNEGDALLFTPGEVSTGAATFSYQAKDSRGTLSEPVEVVIVMANGSLSIDIPDPIPSAGGIYNLELSIYGLWFLENSMPWVTLNNTEGIADFAQEMTVEPNRSTRPRSGQIKFGNITYVLTQSGVMLPELSSPTLPLPPAQVGADYTLEIPTLNLPVIYQVKNLPPGLSINGDTGLITGIPTKAGRRVKRPRPSRLISW